RSTCPARRFTTAWSWLTAPERLVHEPTWVTALCSAVRAAALEVSSALRAAACWDAVTGADGDEAADADDGDGDGDGDGGEAAGGGGAAAGGAGAGRPDTTTPDTTAAAATTTAPAASTRPRIRRPDGSGPGPSGSPTVEGSPALTG